MKVNVKVKKFTKFIWAILVCLSAALIFSGCGNGDKKGGTIVIELYPEYAPATVENFVKLVEEGFYDGLTFHRIYNGFMAQGGGQDVNGDKKQAGAIFGEFANNGFTQNTLKHTKGIISMARSGDPDSASSEFFIMFGDAPGLDGDYAAFGEVTEGMEVVDKLQEVEKMSGFAIDPVPTTPVEKIIIKKATVLSKDGNPKIQMEIEY